MPIDAIEPRALRLPWELLANEARVGSVLAMNDPVLAAAILFAIAFIINR